MLAVTAAVAVTAIATRAAHRSQHQLIILTVATAGYVLTGSALIPLLGAALLEILPTQAATRAATTAEAQPDNATALAHR